MKRVALLRVQFREGVNVPGERVGVFPGVDAVVFGLDALQIDALRAKANGKAREIHADYELRVVVMQHPKGDHEVQVPFEYVREMIPVPAQQALKGKVA